VLKNYSSLSKSVEVAWGKDYYTDNITRQFRENLLQFSGAKSNDLMTRLDDLRSKTKDKESFIDEAKKMVALHNETYLNVEQKFAANSASTAKDFEQFVKDVDIYPCLTNRTIGDGNVRDTHAENEGVTKRVEDWIETPPYDPGCRCWLEQTTDEPTKNGLTGLDSKWANNPYTSGCIFTDKHSYFQNIPDDSRIQVHNNTEMCKLLVPSIPSEEYAERLLISPFAQFEELAINTNTANIILNNNPEIKMKIRPHLDINKMKNPEYTVNGLIADAKRIESWNVASSFKSAIEQECKVVIIDLVKQFDKGYMLNVNELTKNIRNRYADFTNDNINNCHVVWGSKSVIISKNTFKGISNKNIRELDAKIKSIITTLL
jgi:hypothetical protein